MIKNINVYESYKGLNEDFKLSRIFSFGGGVQSTAVLVLQALGKIDIPYDYFIFANVGDDSENPDTIAYMENYTIPFAIDNGIEIISVQKTSIGDTESLLAYMYRTERSIPIPVFLDGGSITGRSCTSDFKITVVDKWIKNNNYSHAIVGLGISTDEIRRMRDERWHDRFGKQKFGFWKKRHYPLIDLRLSRMDCHSIVKNVGLPKPPKSACWFCPYTKRNEWIEMKRNNPELFEKAIELENHLNSKIRDNTNISNVYLHSPTRGSLQPLDIATSTQMSMFDELEDESCDSGYCFT